MCMSTAGGCRSAREERAPLSRRGDGGDNNLALLASPQRPSGEQFRSQLLRTAPHEVVKITCVDWREGDRGAYLLTSAGAVVHGPMLEDLALILSNKKMLLLQGHSDCAKSKAECPRVSGETDAHYAKRIDEWSTLRLWRSAGRLLESPVIQDAILNNGLQFCVAFHDVRQNQLRFFERETAELIRNRFALKAA